MCFSVCEYSDVWDGAAAVHFSSFTQQLCSIPKVTNIAINFNKS